MVIPQNERSSALKQILFEYVNLIANLRNADPNLAKQQPSLFFFLSFPWLVEQNTLTADQKDFLERRKLEAAQLGFDGERAKKQLEDILAVDKHLAECCPTLVQLANYLDTSFIRPVADAKRVGTAQQQLDFAYLFSA